MNDNATIYLLVEDFSVFCRKFRGLVHILGDQPNGAGLPKGR